jgi:hypothetical protein
MKVIGRTSGPSGEYIAIVRHEELEKLTSKYHGKLPKLEIGGEMDLGAGYNFRSDIRSAFAGMEKAMKDFECARATLIRFADLLRTLPEDDAEQHRSCP